MRDGSGQEDVRKSWDVQGVEGYYEISYLRDMAGAGLWARGLKESQGWAGDWKEDAAT